MSYEPPPLEPELLELERELRGLRAIAPDPMLFQRVTQALDEPFEVIRGSTAPAASPLRWSGISALPWKRYAPAAAAAAVILVVAIPSIRSPGHGTGTVQSPAGEPPTVRRSRPAVEMVYPQPGARPVAPSVSNNNGVLEASRVMVELPGAIVPEPPPPAIPEAVSPFGCMGVGVDPVTETLRAHLQHLSLLPEGGAIVQTLVRDGPAHRGGLALHDVITTIDGVSVGGPWHLRELVASRPPGAEVTVGFIRGGELRSVRIKLAAARPSA